MADNRYTNFEIDKTLSRYIVPSVFDRIVKEISVKVVPPKYIEHILIQYQNGNVVELSGRDVTRPIVVSTLTEQFKNIRDIRVFIATDKLEKDVNALVENYLNNYC